MSCHVDNLKNIKLAKQMFYSVPDSFYRLLKKQRENFYNNKINKILISVSMFLA